MLKRIKDFISKVVAIEKEDISDRYMLVMLSVFIFFLFTQSISVLFISLNIFNTIVTFVSLLSMILFFILFKTQAYRLLSKVLFVVVSHILVFAFWLVSDGVLGAIPGLIPVLGFIVVAIMPSEYSLKTLLFTLIFCSMLMSIEFFFPEWIVGYDSVYAKKIDIIVGIYFTFFMVSFSFWYLRSQYSIKENLLQKEVKLQKKLNEELDHFVYRTSHDLRSPISSLLGLITLIRMSDNRDEILRYADLQEKSLLKMDGFIHDIIDYAQNNRAIVLREKIDLQELYENTVQLLFDTQKENNIQVNTTLIWNDKLAYFSDKSRLQVIFKNLISNALRYADKTKAKSFLNIRIIDEPTQTIFTFEDNGIGIPADSIPKIFDMFYRAHQSSMGSGLGLYIVKQNVEALGGLIHCYSEEKIGTCFEMILPKM